MVACPMWLLVSQPDNRSFTPPLHVPKLTFIPRQEIKERELNVSASCQSAITPACLQALYAIPSAPANVSSNTLGVSGFDEQFANEQDLGVSEVMVVIL